MLQPTSMTYGDPNPLVKSSVPLMAVAGLISAVIISPIWILYLLIGPLWGIALVVYFFHTNDAERIPCNSWLAIVVIMDVPDAAWSRFEAQYPVDLFKGKDPVEVYDPDWRYQPAVQFSQKIFKSDRECYSWPSGHLAIELCYMAGPGNEDLLQQFLQKYPSSAFVG